MAFKWAGNMFDIPSLTDIKISSWLPNIFEKWTIDIKMGGKYIHHFKGITLFGLRIAIKTIEEIKKEEEADVT